MVFAVRVLLDMGRWGFVVARFAADGVLHWHPLGPTLETFVFVSISEFGDLFCYAALSRVSRFWHGQFSSLLECFLEFRRSQLCQYCGPVDRSDACQYCAAYGAGSDFAAPCHFCECVTCEDCVAVAAFVVQPRRLKMWVCLGCGTEELFQVVESLKGWFCDEAGFRIHRVLADYNFGFYLRLLALSGDEIRNEQRLPVGLVYTCWDGFDRVWDAVYAKTGGRVRQMVLGPLGLIVVDETSRLLMRWSHCLSRSEARGSTEGSPHVVRVLLRDFF